MQNGLAQSVPALTPANGLGTQITSDGQQFNIQGGQLSGDGLTLLHNFSRFGLDATQTANFISNPTIQTILGRVVGGEASLINGRLQVTGSNANLYLINPAGILFGPQARLDVPGAFMATTADRIGFSNGSWWSVGSNDPTTIAGQPQSFAFLTPQPGAIFNAGNLTVKLGQNVTLLGGTVVNTGTITAPGGTVTIAAVPGEKLVRISQPGTLLSLDLPTLGGVGQASAIATPLSLPQLLTGGNWGNATGVTIEQGVVKLTGGEIIATTPGSTTIAGQLLTSSPLAHAQITVLGSQIALLNATLNASGNAGGGTILVGGDAYGKGTVPNAQFTFINPKTQISADALLGGNGGKVVIWADQATWFGGTITARGSETGGARSDGGFVEVSGQQYLAYRGQVDTTAPNGAIGTLLLDPVDILILSGIEDGATDGPNTFQGGSTPGQVTSPDLGPSIIFESELEGLARTTNVFLEASNTITINDLLDNVLLFPSGPGAGTIEFKAGGTFTMDPSDTIQAPGRSVKISGTALTVGNIDTREGAGGGEIKLTATVGGITAGNLQSAAQTGSGAIAGNGGKITLNAITNIVTQDLTTFSWSGASGALANANNAGDVFVFSPSGNITVGQVNAFSRVGPVSGAGIGNSRSGGLVTLQAPTGQVTAQQIFTYSLAEQGDAGLGGKVDITGATGIDLLGFGIVTYSAVQGTGNASKPGDVILNSSGNILFNSNGFLFANSQTNIGNANSGGSITVNAGGNIVLPTIIASSRVADGNSQNGGNVTLNTSGNITVNSIDASAGVDGRGGVIDITTQQFFRVKDEFVDVNNNQFSISTAGGSAAGPITIRHGGGLNATPFTIGAASTNGTLAAITTGADTISTMAILGNYTQGNITIITQGPSLPPPLPPTSPPLPPTSPALPPTAPLPEDLPLLERPAEIILDSPRIELTRPNINPNELPAKGKGVLTLEARDRTMMRLEPMITALEDRLTQKISAAVGSPALTQLKGLEDARETLSRITAMTGAKPALIYISFVPEMVNVGNGSNRSADRDTLELVLVTTRGNPIRRRVPAAFRARVMAAVRELQEQVTDPKLTQTMGYLRSAQFLYRWMIVPLVSELEAQGINNLTFILDNGLRTIPIAALHDGKSFLIERYSVGLMPSLSLTDTRLGDIKSTQVLAAGTSQFDDRAALPIVPVELANITQKLWRGKALLDQEFTQANLKAQRQNLPYGIIHLATHSEFLPGDVSQSTIQLWQSELYLDQLDQLGWGNPPVELVVLSACRTSLGSSSAELGLAGFTVRTGVKSVLASLWDVSDDGTAGLMSEFYQQLQTAPIKVEALRQAQLALLRGQVYLSNGQLHWSGGSIALPPAAASHTDRTFAHPYYWSAFTMIGSPW
jgi:filamentous hemagglutinin family protein